MQMTESSEKHEDRSRDHFDVVVIGGGHAGLAMGTSSRVRGRRFVILGAGETIARPGGPTHPLQAINRFLELDFMNHLAIFHGRRDDHTAGAMRKGSHS